MNLSTAYVEWEQKTLEQGRQEGEKRLIIRQINKRFDVIPDALVEQIHQLSIEQLELLSEAFLDFSTITDLEQWLENRTQVENWKSYRGRQELVYRFGS